MMIIPNYVKNVDPTETQAMVNEWPLGAWKALELGFGRDKVYVIIHGKGPTDNIQAVHKLLQSTVDINNIIK